MSRRFFLIEKCYNEILLKDWNLSDKVAGFCFNTTVYNTDLRTGTCILLEQDLARNVLNLACCHHVYVMILKAVFTSISGCSSGPDVLLFQRFQEYWSFIIKLAIKQDGTSQSYNLFLKREGVIC